jgi:hypothetical protein
MRRGYAEDCVTSRALTVRFADLKKIGDLLKELSKKSSQ